jgi:starch phosphorylase
VPATIPDRLTGLATVARNLSWSWHREARIVFRSIDERLWHGVRHNPLKFLDQVPQERLDAAAADARILKLYDQMMNWFRHEQSGVGTWFNTTFPEHASKPVAYFCAEFGIHNSVPIYSGGLGVLAGDHCKAASDLGVPLVGVGILYRAGYFDQRINLEGRQQDSDERYDLSLTPITPISGPGGVPYLATVRTFGRDVHIRAWRLDCGRVPLYLLDTDLEENHPDDRPLLSKLYAGGPALRLRQEWLLGVGGVRVLRALGIHPQAWHANEGHAAFMLVERVREYVSAGMSYAEATAKVRAASTFTTHTPVPAGHDQFGPDQVEACAGPVWDEMGITRDEFFAIGHHPVIDHQTFHMTATAIRLSKRVNGVAKRHGVVTREIWNVLWPDRPQAELPIGHVTNGVHLATWMANHVMQLCDRTLGAGWGSRTNDPATWDAILEADDHALWHAHRTLKDILLNLVREDARRAFVASSLEAPQIVGAGVMLDPNVLTIGFARRFATYKRAALIFRDPERLRKLLTNRERPVQLVFAGKAHPADNPGKDVLQTVYQFTRDPRFEGRVAFVEDYDMHLAHLLVQGVDLWMNMPKVPMEASGTSGMKAALNGVPQLSTVDGWWEEGYDGTNGWAIGQAGVVDDDAETAERLYTLLETEVVPRFYTRDEHGLPRQWITMMKHAMRNAGRFFTAHRMVEEYARDYYVPSFTGGGQADDPPTA